jgi:uncharacterized metal-binding protein
MEDQDIKDGLERVEALYDGQSLEVMRTAESAFEKGSNRVEEIRNYARKAGLKRIGIAHCISFPRETEALSRYLAEEFEVFSVDCKCGRISKQEMLGEEGKGPMCNPAGQAHYLAAHGTELNISMGLCVGHDMIFNQKSMAPVSTLLVKDRPSGHHPLDSIRKVSGMDPA